MRTIWMYSLAVMFGAAVGLGAEAPGKLCTPVGSTSTSAKSGTPHELAVSVKGSTSNGQMKLELAFGHCVTRGVRIYSEPSHTLLALIADRTFRKTTEGEAWLRSHQDATPPGAVIISDLPAAQPNVVIGSKRPPSDDRIAVWINGNFPLIGEVDRLVADGRVGAGDFAFRTSLESAP